MADYQTAKIGVLCFREFSQGILTQRHGNGDSLFGRDVRFYLLTIIVDEADIKCHHPVKGTASLIQSSLGIRIVFIAFFKRRNRKFYRLGKSTFRYVNNNEYAVKLGLVMRENLFDRSFLLFKEFLFQEVL